MKKQIWKFELHNTDRQEVEMPISSEILTIKTQRGTPCLWALVNPSAEKEVRIFEVFGTGHDVYYDMGISRNYINTYQLNGGGLVFHVFEYTGV